MENLFFFQTRLFFIHPWVLIYFWKFFTNLIKIIIYQDIFTDLYKLLFVSPTKSLTIKMKMNCLCGMVYGPKAFKPYFQPGPLLEILTIANLRHAASRVWACAEPEFRLGWMKLCSSDNHYTTTLLVKYQYFAICCSVLQLRILKEDKEAVKSPKKR